MELGMLGRFLAMADEMAQRSDLLMKVKFNLKGRPGSSSADSDDDDDAGDRDKRSGPDPDEHDEQREDGPPGDDHEKGGDTPKEGNDTDKVMTPSRQPATMSKRQGFAEHSTA